MQEMNGTGLRARNNTEKYKNIRTFISVPLISMNFVDI